ncbi:MAG: DUF2750 domain-containing protein [Cellvibrionaceae bacterium]|nr:DUF2750 domain-containing protein [Cellvibrionaceae bacterium]
MGCLWGLESAEGWAQCASEKHADTVVMPFWSQPEYAEIHRCDQWQDYRVTAIALEEFLDDWLLGMHKDVVLVGINWNAQLEGEEYEPLDILHEFEQALKD